MFLGEKIVYHLIKKKRFYFPLFVCNPKKWFKKYFSVFGSYEISPNICYIFVQYEELRERKTDHEDELRRKRVCENKKPLKVRLRSSAITCNCENAFMGSSHLDSCSSSPRPSQTNKLEGVRE